MDKYTVHWLGIYKQGTVYLKLIKHIYNSDFLILLKIYLYKVKF